MESYTVNAEVFLQSFLTIHMHQWPEGGIHAQFNRPVSHTNIGVSVKQRFSCHWKPILCPRKSIFNVKSPVEISELYKLGIWKISAMIYLPACKYLLNVSYSFLLQ